MRDGFGTVPTIPSALQKEPKPVYSQEDFIVELRRRLQTMNLEVRKNLIWKRNVKAFEAKCENLVWLKEEKR